MRIRANSETVAIVTERGLGFKQGQIGSLSDVMGELGPGLGAG